MNTAPTTWILVADAAHAVVLQTIGVGHKLLPVPGFSIDQALPQGRDMARDRPPRAQESSGPARHAIEPKSDPRREMKRAFADEIAERLDAAATAKAFDRLIVVAPPQMLGDLRASFSDVVRSHIATEIARDFVKLPHEELRAHLAPFVVV